MPDVAHVTAGAGHIGLAAEATAFSVLIPAGGRVAGNLALVAGGSNNATGTISTPAGWTQLFGPNYTTGQLTYLWAKILDGTETTFTATASVLGRLHGCVEVLSGAKMPTTANVTHLADSVGGAATLAGGSVITRSANNLIVGMALIRNVNLTVKATSAVTTGWTERVDNGTAFATAPQFSVAIATRTALVPASGTEIVGPTWTSSDTSVTGQSYMIAVEPIAAPDGPAPITGVEGWVAWNNTQLPITGGKVAWDNVWL